MGRNQEIETPKEIIGLIPAGGQGARLGPLPCSKEIYPIGFDQGREERPKAICHYLFEKMRLADIKKAYIILREGKWDIPAYLRDGKMLGIHLAYLIMDVPFGVPFTIDQAFPFVQEATIAFGFPDIFFEQDDVFVKLLDRLKRNHCDVVLGLFPSDRPDKADMVDIDTEGKIKNIVIKPQLTDLRFTWGAAVWTPFFTKFMHRYVEAMGPFAAQRKELFIGEVVQSAIDEGLQVEARHISDEPFIDIGTSDDLLKAAKGFMAKTEKNH
jgi:glucose-1-phosphate thymidylyltransferase